jgi:hypothetical protein
VRCSDGVMGMELYLFNAIEEECEIVVMGYRAKPCADRREVWSLEIVW